MRLDGCRPWGDIDLDKAVSRWRGALRPYRVGTLKSPMYLVPSWAFEVTKAFVTCFRVGEERQLPVHNVLRAIHGGGDPEGTRATLDRARAFLTVLDSGAEPAVALADTWLAEHERTRLERVRLKDRG